MSLQTLLITEPPEGGSVFLRGGCLFAAAPFFCAAGRLLSRFRLQKAPFLPEMRFSPPKPPRTLDTGAPFV